MSEWREVSLGNFCSIGSSKRIFYSEYVESGVPFWRSKEVIVQHEGGLVADPLFISEERYAELGKYGYPEEGDLLLTSVGTIGIPYLVKARDRFYFKDGNLTWFKNFSEELDSRYLYYFIESHLGQGRLNGLLIGSSQKALTISALNTLQIPLPPITTQKRIVEVLSAYDELIENNRKQIKLLEEAAQRLYKEWFIDLRFPGYEAVPADTETGLPDGWKSVHLADIVSKVTTGLNPRKNFVLGQGSNYYVTIKNMSNNDVYLDDRCDRVDDEAIELINRRSDLQLGDVLFSAVGTIGRVYLVSIPLGNWNVNESIFTLRANELVSKEFLYLLLLSFDLQQYCKANSHGVAQPGIRMADLKQFELKLPDAALMREFTAQVGPLIKLAQSLKENAKRLQEARDRLLPKLMSGEIEVS